MKKICLTALSFVLIAALFAGCRNSGTVPPTTAPTRPTTTTATTAPTTAPTTEAATDPIIDTTTTPTDGEIMPSEKNGADMPGENPATGDMSRGRGIIPMR